MWLRAGAFAGPKPLVGMMELVLKESKVRRLDPFDGAANLLPICFRFGSGFAY